MSCGSGISCYKSGVVPGGLGFLSSRCTPCPCPDLPLADVRICFQVNSVSQVVIQQGCDTSSAVPPGVVLEGTVTVPATIAYQPGITEDSWGKSCRTIIWQRAVQGSRFIRIRVCAASDCASCSDGAYTANGTPITNQLLKFTVNGSSILDGLTAMANALNVSSTHDQIVSTDGKSTISQVICATVEYQPITIGAYGSIPVGTEIVVGPLNDISLVPDS